MADHYDTAYMADRYEPQYGGNGARVAAAGADDNHSATAALMLAAPMLLDLSQEGQLGCDVWLVHLTGEEFPSDCLGARALTQRLVEGTLKLHLPGGKTRDLSKTEVRGVYVMDMIAHNNDRERTYSRSRRASGRRRCGWRGRPRSPRKSGTRRRRCGTSRPARRGRGRGRRSPTGGVVPEVAAHPALARRGADAGRPAQHAVQHRRPGLLRRRRAGGAVHGELRHQSAGISRHARHDGEHRPGLRRGAWRRSPSSRWRGRPRRSRRGGEGRTFGRRRLSLPERLRKKGRARRSGGHPCRRPRANSSPA